MDTKVIFQNIDKLKELSEAFFKAARDSCVEKEEHSWISPDNPTNKYWDMLPDDVQILSQVAQEKSLQLIAQIIPTLKSSPILNESDDRDIGICAKRMRAALRLRDYRSWNTEVLHDEGEILGVSPPGQSDNAPSSPLKSEKSFFRCIEKFEGIVQLLEITPIHIPDGLPAKNPNLHQSYRPNTAFIMMPINSENPELDDIYETYKNCFSMFGIEAIRADEIEHEDIITKRIIAEITTSEFLVGDLTLERPSVYYEIGYAHSMGRRVILYRKSGTSIHFDLAAYNCPEYKNMKELKKILLKRLEEATNRKIEG